MQTKIMTDGNPTEQTGQIHFNDEELKTNPSDNINPPESITSNNKSNPDYSDQVRSKRIGIVCMAIGTVSIVMSPFFSKSLLLAGLLLFIIGDCIRAGHNFITIRLFKKLFKRNEVK